MYKTIEQFFLEKEQELNPTQYSLSKTNMNCDFNIILKRIRKNRDKIIVLFGANLGGIAVMNSLRERNIEINYFCDNYNINTDLQGIPIIHIDTLCKIKDECIVIITAIAYDEILEQMCSLNIADIVIGVANTLWGLGVKSVKNNNIDKINEVYNFLSDDKSKMVYIKLLKGRYYSDLSHILSIADSPKNQYFDKDIVKLKNSEIFADCGAFDGDTIREFIKLVDGNFEKIIAIEPDDENFKKLDEYIKTIQKGRVIAKNVGVYKKDTKLMFNTGFGSSSNISNKGENYIQVVSIDNCFNDKITFLKMDIEGAELDALEGSKETILRYKPILAICVYHKTTDLWEIPMYIKSILPEYKIYIRHYSKYFTETVCYAVCDNSYNEEQDHE